ncbi:MAG: DUF4276 family protein [Paludibacteraceae bacterium]|nr:DUF4276 family protein [Paludibacteraceae bacterium]
MGGDIYVYISAEDSVTIAIIKRLLAFTSPRFKVFKNIPARGGEIKSKIQELNKLSETRPVVALLDLDANACAPILKQSLLQGNAQNIDFIFNIAIDEAEAWLMADKVGFARYFGISQQLIPDSSMQRMGGMKLVQELDSPMKSSLQLTHQIMPSSINAELRVQMMAQGKAAKGKEYNSAIVPFIDEVWDVTAASANSDSLRRMVKRLKNLISRYP